MGEIDIDWYSIEVVVEVPKYLALCTDNFISLTISLKFNYTYKQQYAFHLVHHSAEAGFEPESLWPRYNVLDRSAKDPR